MFKIVKEMFAPMEYLDAHLEEYRDGYPNPRTQRYYETLKRIRELQSQGVVPPDELFKSLWLRGKADATVEYGYYTSNIHYYLFESCSEFQKTEEYKESVNRRILLWLESADPKALLKRQWFPWNFPPNYLRFLKMFYGDDCGRKWGIEEYAERYGDPLERQIGRLSVAIAYS